MNLHSAPDDQIPFADPEMIFDGFSQEDIIDLAYCSGDFILAIDAQGVIRDVAVNVNDHGLVRPWVGKKWAETVTVESLPKIQAMLDTKKPHEKKWRQVNHPHDGEDIPINYRVVKPAGGDWHLAVARDLRDLSALQQRLLKTQQSLERDYLHLRQTETRYRLLFDNISYPVLIASAGDLKIRQANRAGHDLFGAGPPALEDSSLLDLVAPGSRDKLMAYMGAISVSDLPDPLEVGFEKLDDRFKLSASAFRQSGQQYWLINIEDGAGGIARNRSEHWVLEAVDKMPDAFVLADQEQKIIIANRAFAEMVQAGTAEQLAGMPLDRFVGRPAIDLDLLSGQLRKHQFVRNFSSVVHDTNGRAEPVEISAVMVERDEPLYGYSLRSVGRRERDLPPTEAEFPRSVDQLTDLVGRKTLKQIVRESTDLIERMCIEAALVHTSDNRASAAEILGLSRQSLYSKLHRHGLGNLGGKG